MYSLEKIKISDTIICQFHSGKAAKRKKEIDKEFNHVKRSYI